MTQPVPGPEIVIAGGERLLVRPVRPGDER